MLLKITKDCKINNTEYKAWDKILDIITGDENQLVNAWCAVEFVRVNRNIPNTKSIPAIEEDVPIIANENEVIKQEHIKLSALTRSEINEIAKSKDIICFQRKTADIIEDILKTI